MRINIKKLLGMEKKATILMLPNGSHIRFLRRSEGVYAGMDKNCLSPANAELLANYFNNSCVLN